MVWEVVVSLYTLAEGVGLSFQDTNHTILKNSHTHTPTILPCCHGSLAENPRLRVTLKNTQLSKRLIIPRRAEGQTSESRFPSQLHSKRVLISTL